MGALALVTVLCAGAIVVEPISKSLLLPQEVNSLAVFKASRCLLPQ
jgi:hypothetical protein